MENELIEHLSSYQHEIWAHWMNYMFSKCYKQTIFENDAHFETGNLIIPKELIEKWQRQIDTPYSELTEIEKKSDRDQVLKFIHLIS